MTEDKLYRLTLTDIYEYDTWNNYNTPCSNIVSYSSPHVQLKQEERVFDNSKSASEYIEKYFDSFSTVKNNFTETGLMPPGLKAIGTNYIVFEKPPCFKNIFFIPTMRCDIEKESIPEVYRLPIPWQLYIVKFNSDMYVYEVRMYFMKTSLTSVHQELFLPPLPNFYTNGMLCPPIMDNMEDVDRYPKNHTGVMQCGYDWVWNSGTNHDLSESCLHLSIQIKQENSVLKYLSELEYNSYFKYKNTYNREYSRYVASYQQIFHIFTAWEKSYLNEVCELSWPNTSGTKPNFIYDENSYQEEDGYYDHLYDFFNDMDSDLSEDRISEMIENGDYNSQEYHQYLSTNSLISKSNNNPWDHVYTYFETMKEIIVSLNKELCSSSTSLQYDINFANLTMLKTV